MNNTTSLDSTYFTIPVIIGISFETLITLCIVVFNTVVMIAIISFPGIRQVKSNYPIINLAITDFVLGTVVCPVHLVYRIKGTWAFGDLACSFHQGIMGTVCHESIFSAMILVVDKYISIKYPLRYNVLVTPRRLCIVIGITWVISVGICLVPALPRWNHDLSVDIIYYPLCYPFKHGHVIFNLFPALLPLIVIIYANHYIFKVLRKQMRQINAQPPTLRSEPNGNSNPADPQMQTFSAGETKQIKTIFIVAVVFLILWMPVYIALLFNYFCNCASPENVEITHWLGFANSAINPLIYAYKKDFRRAYGKILHWKAMSKSADNI